MSENPFHSRWYRAAAFLQPLYRVLGFTLCLKRCSWTTCGARLTLAWVGWELSRRQQIVILGSFFFLIAVLAGAKGDTVFSLCYFALTFACLVMLDKSE